MKILYISQRTTVHDRRFLQAMLAGGHQPFFLRTQPETEETPISDDIELVDYFDAHRAIDEIHPDLIHAGPVPEGAYLAAQTGFQPLISMSWGSDLLREVDQNSETEERARYALEHSSLLLADCDAVKKKAVSLSFPEEKVVIFPWGIDLEKFRPGRNYTLRKKLGWEEKFVIFHSRSWEEVYGVDVMAKGFAEVSQYNADLRLLLLGGGSREDEIKEIFSKAGVMDKVHFSGHIDQSKLPEYYNAADLYLSASHSDGSSISLLEAMASGLPAVVTDIPGNREWVQHGENGWFFPDGDWEQLADRLNEAKNSINLTEMTKANRMVAEARADWNKSQKKLLEAYRIIEQE